MNLIQFDNVIKNPEQYLEEVIKYEFVDEQTGEKAFGDIQQRNEKDEFSDFVLSMFLGYEITLNFIIMSNSRLIWMNGKLIPETEAKISVYDSALMFGDMVFEMTRSVSYTHLTLPTNREV